MNRTAKTALYALGGAAVVNVVLGYLTSNYRTGRQAGQNKLLDFNDSLLRFNPLAALLPQSAGPSVPATPAGTTYTHLPAPQVTESPGGTTTYFGS